MVKFKYKDSIIETPNLEKKLKRMKISIQDIEILEDTNKKKELPDTDVIWKYYIFQNSKGNYLWGINRPSIDYYERDFGIDISDYRLIDTVNILTEEYQKYNPDTKTGIKINVNNN